MPQEAESGMCPAPLAAARQIRVCADMYGNTIPKSQTTRKTRTSGMPAYIARRFNSSPLKIAGLLDAACLESASVPLTRR